MESADVISERRVEAIRLLVAAFSASGTRWEALHGAESYPAKVGRDLDVLVNPADLETATGVARKALELGGWRVVVIRMPWKVNQVIGFETGDAGTIAVEVDFLCYQIWRGVGLVCGLPVSVDNNIESEALPSSGWAGFVKRVLIQCLAGNWSKMEARRSEWELSPSECVTVPAELERRVGIRESRLFLEALKKRDAAALVAASQRVGRRLQFHGLVSDGFWFGSLPRWIAYKTADFVSIRPRAPRLDIAFDSSVTETRRREFIDYCELVFRRQLVFASVSSAEAEVLIFKRWKQDLGRCRDAAMMRLGIQWGGGGCRRRRRGLVSVEVAEFGGGIILRNLGDEVEHSCPSVSHASDLLANWICQSLAKMHAARFEFEIPEPPSVAPMSKA